MFIRTILVSALFLAFSCVSLQASTDTSLNVPSNTTDDTVLLFAGVKDRRKGNQDADECDAADACYDKCATTTMIVSMRVRINILTVRIVKMVMMIVTSHN